MQTGAARRRDFGMGMMRFIDSRDIWLALDDHHHDSRLFPGYQPDKTELLLVSELDLYHAQLFRWRLIRSDRPIFQELSANST